MALSSDSFKNNLQLQSATNGSPLRTGSAGPGVSLLQLALASLDYSMPRAMRAIVPDGVYGPETTAAVMAFQRDQGLLADGVAGQETLSCLDEIFAGQPALPQPPFPPPRVVKDLYGGQRGRDNILDATFRPAGGPGPKLQLGFAVFADVIRSPDASDVKIVSPPSADWEEIGKTSWYKVGVNGPDNDLGANDRKSGDGKPPFAMWPSYRAAVCLTDSALEQIWRAAFDNVHDTGPLGQKMIDKFMSGNGGVYYHLDGADLSKTARDTNTFGDAHKGVLKEIQKQLKAQLDAGAIDWRKLSLDVVVPFSAFTLDYTVPLRFRAMIGGIKGTKLFTRNFNIYSPAYVTAHWFATFDLWYQMGDHFGVGSDDMYSPDLVAMNVLQHERAGHKPFLNYIDIKVPNISLNFDT